MEGIANRLSIGVGTIAPSIGASSGEHVVDGDLALLVSDPEPRGGVALRVEVDDQDPVAELGEGRPRLTAVVLLPTPPFWLATAMIRAGREAAGAAFEAADARPRAFERRCTAVGCVPEASLLRLEAGFGLEDERAAREEEGFVTDES